MTRDEALKILYDNMQSVNLRRHCLAVEAVMRALARRFGGDPETSADAKAGVPSGSDKWGIAGLLHDADYEQTKDAPKEHTRRVLEWLKGLDADKDITNAVLAHGWGFVEGNPEPKTKMEWALYTCDELTGFIVAVALVRPDKKLASVGVDSILKKWGEKSFAAGVHREQVELCESKLGIPLSEFVTISLEAMQGISQELGL